jgi:hypothetical protein
MTAALPRSIAGWFTGETRKAFCVCGREYEQLKLTDRVLATMREFSRPAIDIECPGGWVPLNCPPCEHVALGIDARVADRGHLKLLPAVQRAEDIRYERAEREGMSL